MKKLLTAVALAAAAVGAQAATIAATVTGPAGLELTEISQVFSFNNFDTSLGTLNFATITFGGMAESSVTLENTSSGAQRFSFASNLSLFLDGLGGDVAEVMALSLFNYGPVMTPVGLTDLGTVTPSDSYSFNVSSAAALALLSGAGSSSLTCESLVSNTQSGGGGNIEVKQNTMAGCNLAVTYDYSVPPPPSAPEPASLALVGLALAGVAASRRKKA